MSSTSGVKLQSWNTDLPAGRSQTSTSWNPLCAKEIPSPRFVATKNYKKPTMIMFDRGTMVKDAAREIGNHHQGVPHYSSRKLYGFMTLHLLETGKLLPDNGDCGDTDTLLALRR